MSRAQPKPCPHCGRRASECWAMPCLELQLKLDSVLCGVPSSADAVNTWLIATDSPYRIEAKA